MTIIGALIALGAWTAAAAPNFPLGTHIMKGSLKGYAEYLAGTKIIAKPAADGRTLTFTVANTDETATSSFFTVKAE